MKGFKYITLLPYCVRSIDGSDVNWTACPSDRFLDYKCFRNFSNLVIFTARDSKRKFMYAGVGAPGVLGDATSIQNFLLKRQ